MKSTHAPALVPTPPAGSLFDTPLPRLLADFNVVLRETSAVPDRAFTGLLELDGAGGGVLKMPSGRPGWEREIAARVILAEAFDLPWPAMPAMLAASRV
jgi:hypothetical protein